MKKHIYYISIILLLFNQNICSQNSVQKLTLSLIDTSLSQTEQARLLYNWLIINIKYDRKELLELEPKAQTPNELLKSKKGLCSDFARLYQKMCETAGIESYVINGYSKGFGYNPQKPFLRSNHTWNVIYADSNWVHVDAWRGAGYLSYSPHTYRKILYTIARVPYTRNKLVFTSEPVNDFFNIPIDSLLKTHYPADPKWLFTKSPLSFRAFETDSILAKADYPFYNKEIEKIRGKSESYQLVEEGKNAIKFNPLNNFDLAKGYYVKTQNHVIERDVTEDNLYQFNSFTSDYEIIIESLDQYRETLDSIYRGRYNNIRQKARIQKRLTRRIKSKAKKAQKTHRSSQKKIVGKSSSYKRKMNKYQLNIGRAEIRKVSFVILKDMHYTDTNAVNSIKNDIWELEATKPRLYRKMDSLLIVVDGFAETDAKIDDSIVVANRLFKTNIDELFENILLGDEKFILSYIDSLTAIYTDIEDFLQDKKTAKYDLQKTGRAFYSYSSELQRNLKKIMTLNSKLQRLTNDADSVIKAYNQTIDELISSYKKSMLFTQKLNYHNEIQSDIRSENLAALKEQKKSIRKENKFFESWYENTIANDKRLYVYEKYIVKEMRKEAYRNMKKVELQIKRFKKD